MRVDVAFLKLSGIGIVYVSLAHTLLPVIGENFSHVRTLFRRLKHIPFFFKVPKVTEHTSAHSFSLSFRL